MTRSEHRRALIGGLRKLGSWFVLSNIIRIASTVIVTRFLNPRDFALLAVVFAIQSFATKLTAFNMFSELVRAKELDGEDLRVAWTYELLRNTLLWLVLVIFAPVFATWMGRPEVVWPLRVTSSSILILGLMNPRIVELRRAGRFGMIGFMDGLNTGAYALCSVVLVWLKPDYWALVYAGLVGPLVSVVAMYVVAPWRPGLSFNLERAKPMFAFGVVLLAVTGLQALRENGMVFLLNSQVYEDDLGYYNRAVAFSFSLALAATSLFWRVAYPMYSQHEIAGHSSLLEASRTQRIILLVTLPVTAVVAIFSERLIGFAVEAKWTPMAPVWSWFVLAGALALANAPYEVAFQARRREKMSMVILALSTVVQLFIAWLLLPVYGVASAGMAAAASILLSIVAYRVIGAKLQPVGAAR